MFENLFPAGFMYVYVYIHTHIYVYMYILWLHFGGKINECLIETNIKKYVKIILLFLPNIKYKSVSTTSLLIF